MLANSNTIAFIATSNAELAKQFYSDKLGLQLLEDTPFALVYQTSNTVLRIQKTEQSSPPPYTSLGWEVQEITSTATALTDSGVVFEHFDGLPQDEQGVWTTPDGAKIAWFKDPDGNLLSLTQAAQ